jgi:hypothetical protein
LKVFFSPLVSMSMGTSRVVERCSYFLVQT